MIVGHVANRRAFVSLRVGGPTGEADIEFVLDTGYTGTLTLPLDACSALGLTFVRTQPAGLADGSRIMLDVHRASVAWDTEHREMEVLAMDNAPLVGMTALEDSDVRLQIVEGGIVTVGVL